METLPVDVVRYMSAVFLSDMDRLNLAQVNHKCCAIACLDARAVVYDSLLNVNGQPGFHKTAHGYWSVSFLDTLVDVDLQPKKWGCLAATEPWTFVQRWLCLPKDLKSEEFRRQCVHDVSLQIWHRDVLVSMKVLLTCNHDECGRLCSRLLSSTDKILLRRAVWYGKTDIVSCLLDEGCIDADADYGMALRLALSTLGYENTEENVAELVHELLKRGANPIRHGLWGIRLCLHLHFHIVGSLMCVYAMKWTRGQQLLSSFVQELETQGQTEQAYLVKISMKNFMFLCV